MVRFGERSLLNDPVSSLEIEAGAISNSHINAAAAIAYSKLASDPVISRVKTGTYTGDGSTSKAITGVGFQPKYLLIAVHNTVNDQQNDTVQKLADMPTDGAIEDGIAIRPWFFTNRIISLDADGFTVSDYTNDSHPNKNNQVYDYVAFG